MQYQTKLFYAFSIFWVTFSLSCSSNDSSSQRGTSQKTTEIKTDSDQQGDATSKTSDDQENGQNSEEQWEGVQDNSTSDINNSSNNTVQNQNSTIDSTSQNPGITNDMDDLNSDPAVIAPGPSVDDSTPSNVTVSLSETQILAKTTINQIVSLTATGTGLSKLSNPFPTSYSNAISGASEKQFSIQNSAHWFLLQNGIKRIKGNLDQQALDAAMTYNYPQGFTANSKVIGISINEILLLAQGKIASVKTTGSTVVDLPPGITPIGVGLISNRDGFWAVTETNLYMAIASGTGTYSWSDPVEIDLEVPVDEKAKSVLLDVELNTDDTPKFGNFYSLLTDKTYYLRSTNAGGNAGSASEVGSN